MGCALRRISFGAAALIVLLTMSTAEMRVERLMAERGLDLDQAWAEIDAGTQAADVILANEGSVGQLDALVATFWDDETAPRISAGATRV